MMEIKEEAFEDMYNDGKHWNCIFSPEEKQQILQDQKLRGLMELEIASDRLIHTSVLRQIIEESKK